MLQYVRDYMRHQCLTRLRSSYICIVLQRCMLLNRGLKRILKHSSGGTIGDLIKNKKGRPPPIIRELHILPYLNDILNGLDFLHQRGIVHRDVKDIAWAFLFAYLRYVGRQPGISAFIKSGVQRSLMTSPKDPFPLSFPTLFSPFMQKSSRKKVLVGDKLCMFFSYRR